MVVTPKGKWFGKEYTEKQADEQISRFEKAELEKFESSSYYS